MPPVETATRSAATPSGSSARACSVATAPRSARSSARAGVDALWRALARLGLDGRANGLERSNRPKGAAVGGEYELVGPLDDGAGSHGQSFERLEVRPAAPPTSPSTSRCPASSRRRPRTPRSRDGPRACGPSRKCARARRGCGRSRPFNPHSRPLRKGAGDETVSSSPAERHRYFSRCVYRRKASSIAVPAVHDCRACS